MRRQRAQTPTKRFSPVPWTVPKVTVTTKPAGDGWPVAEYTRYADTRDPYGLATEPVPLRIFLLTSGEFIWCDRSSDEAIAVSNAINGLLTELAWPAISRTILKLTAALSLKLQAPR